MKVANTNTASTNLMQESNAKKSAQARIQTQQNKQNDTTESLQASQSSRLKLGKESTKDLDIVVKNANATIGSLDVMIRSIHSLQRQNKAYHKLALQAQSQTQANPSKATSIADKASALKEQMQETFDTAMFGGENVFTRGYAEIPESNLNAKKLSPHKLDIKQPENLEQYGRDLSEQRSYAKQARKLMQKVLEERLDSIQKTDSSYERLDSSKLHDQEFKAAQGSSGVTLDRVLHLLR